MSNLLAAAINEQQNYRFLVHTTGSDIHSNVIEIFNQGIHSTGTDSQRSPAYNTQNIA